ncbi:MAG: ABC transporter ATP-binding protein [Granulosicoccus sp.]
MSKLELRGASKRYKKETVVDKVSLAVAEGETLVLFGPSGAGKTVLLRMIAGVVVPDEGQIFIDGHDMEKVEAEDRGIGMAFQNFALFPHMNAFDNIASPLTVGRNSRDGIKSGVEKVARLLKIDHVLTHTPRELSNGQKQRTALARALAGSPPILLLDDPLRNVDAKLRFEMRLELPQLLEKQGATVVYVTQDYKEAMALGHRIAVLSQGRIEQIGTPADIYLQPASMDIARLFGDPVINLFDVVGEQDEKGVFV